MQKDICANPIKREYLHANKEENANITVLPSDGGLMDDNLKFNFLQHYNFPLIHSLRRSKRKSNSKSTKLKTRKSKKGRKREREKKSIFSFIFCYLCINSISSLSLCVFL